MNTHTQPAPRSPLISSRISILRHGECEGGRIFRGRSDVALLPAGKMAMYQALQRVPPHWQGVWSSPLQRCRLFAQEYCARHNLPLLIEPKLREIDFGVWDGQAIDKVWQTDRATIEGWSRDPSSVTPAGGEPLHQAAQRVQQLLDALRHQQKNILLITHGGIIRLMLGTVLNMPLAALNRFEVPYACLSQLAFYQDSQRTLTKLLSHNPHAEPSS